MNALAPQAEWQQRVLAYAAAVNAYVERGQRDGWKRAGKEPAMAPTKHLLEPWRAALIAANAVPGAHDAFRDAWPPAHLPLLPCLDAEGMQVPTLLLLDDGSMLARVGAGFEPGRIVHIRGDQVETVDGITDIGRCPARRFFAVANARGVTVHDGWPGPQVSAFAWPTGLEDLPDGLTRSPYDGALSVTQLLPFPGGQQVLLVCSEGIFLLTSAGARRVLPSTQDLADSLVEADGETDDVVWGLSMEHGAVSPDGRWIAVGCQDGPHRVLDAELHPVASIGPVGEYPHFALFNRRGDHAIFNACHFYNGATLGVAVKDLPGLDTDFYADDPRTPTLQNGARVYAAAHRGDEYIVGDAHGYVRAFSEAGDERWQLFIGSSIGAIDVSADGRTLAVSTCAGFVSVVALDAGGYAPWQIGTGGHRELRRWVFWKGFERPMLW